jgi:hypothetical protein
LRGAVEPQLGEPQKDITLMGIEASFAPSLGSHANSDFIRRVVNKKTGETAHQLYVQNYYTGHWRQWDAARDENADPLQFATIKKEVVACANSICTRAEIFRADLDDALLRRRAASGEPYRIMFSAKSGREMVISIAPRQIRAQLAAIDRLRTPQKAPSDERVER